MATMKNETSLFVWHVCFSAYLISRLDMEWYETCICEYEQEIYPSHVERWKYLRV